MQLRPLLFVVLLAGSPWPATGAAEATSPGEPAKRKWSMRDLVRARMLEEAKKTPAPAPVDSAKTAPGSTETPETQVQPEAASASKETRAPVVLPPVEVRKSRITELDQQLARQEQEIAREKKNQVISEPDRALNDLRTAKPLAIFGGESAQFRQHVANERVALMEAEKDLLEAIAHARTAAEKAELQKQLNELKAMRRDLDRTLR